MRYMGIGNGISAKKISHHALKIWNIRIVENYSFNGHHNAQNAIAEADDGNSEKAINVQQLGARVLKSKKFVQEIL